jgi:hypothetical protein
MIGLHTVFPGANLEQGYALNSIERQPTALNSSVFPAASPFLPIEWSGPPDWR